jgi:hypothetical protein
MFKMHSNGSNNSIYTLFSFLQSPLADTAVSISAVAASIARVCDALYLQLVLRSQKAATIATQYVNLTIVQLLLLLLSLRQ